MADLNGEPKVRLSPEIEYFATEGYSESLPRKILLLAP